MDHDQRFKILIREFFAEFLLLFFSDWAAKLDLSAPEWLDKELFPDPPDGPRHILDLVARVPMRDSATSAASLILVHFEIESPDRTTLLKPRFPYYYHALRSTYQLPVLPIAIYLKVGLNGVGIDVYVEKVGDFEVNRFQFLYVGLPALDGLEYVQGDNWLGVALSALMRIPRDRVAWLGAEALRRLAGAPLTAQQKFLLGDCVQAYLPLDEAGKRDLEQILQTESYSEVRAMNQTVFEKGLEQGREQGRVQGRTDERVEVVLSLIEDRFGSVPLDLRTRLERMSMEDLRRLTLKITKISSLDELELTIESI